MIIKYSVKVSNGPEEEGPTYGLKTWGDNGIRMDDLMFERNLLEQENAIYKFKNAVTLLDKYH